MTGSAVHAKDHPRTGGILWAAVGSALVYGAGASFPFIAPLAAVSPFPLLLVRLRSGMGGSLLGVASAAALILALLSPGHALAYLAFFAMPALLMGESVARGRGMVRGCAVAFAVLGAEILTVLLFASPRVEQVTYGVIDALRSPALLADMRAGGWPAEQVEVWVERVAMTHRLLEVVYPAVYVILGALVILANAALLRVYLRRRDPGWLEAGEFENIRFPVVLTLLFVLSGLAVVSQALRPFGYNVLLVVAFFFALQGLAVVGYYVSRLAAPAVLRGAVMLLVLLNPLQFEILALIGLFDIFLDFRKYAEPPESQRG
jgi:uncharacterized protein YybS (DUF2232 family)